MIQLVVIDVDGTLTDGKVYLDSEGKERYAFSKLDGEGFNLLVKEEIKILILTKELSPVFRNRFKKFNYIIFKEGVTDKYNLLNSYIKRELFKEDEIAYIGDDKSDYDCKELVYSFYCPKNAYLLNYVSDEDFIHELSREGGQGAVREAIDLILEDNSTWIKK